MRVKCVVSAGPRETEHEGPTAKRCGPWEKDMAYPKDYKYTKEHEWIQVKGNSATVGITDHAQESLGDIVFVELPKVGAQVEAGKSFGTVESVKAVSELYAPASGKVVAINESLNQSPEAVNQDAHAAWMIKLELTNPSQADALMSADDYEKYVAEEK
jgi:glycine cleavage system H protein